MQEISHVAISGRRILLKELSYLFSVPRQLYCSQVSSMATLEIRRRKKSTRVPFTATMEPPKSGDRLDLVISRGFPPLVIAIHGVLLGMLFTLPVPTSSAAPALLTLLGQVDIALRSGGIRPWLVTGSELVSAEGTSDAALTHRHFRLALGVPHGTALRVARALSDTSLFHTETRAGLRVFANAATGAKDYTTPYVDLVYYRRDGQLLMSPCCKCSAKPPPIAACTKKTCGCLICVSPISAVYPLVPLRVDGLVVLAPQLVDLVFTREEAHPYGGKVLANITV